MDKTFFYLWLYFLPRCVWFMPRSVLTLSLSTLAFVVPISAAQVPALAEGQVWTFQTRRHEPDSRVVVMHLYQPAKGERIAYVAVLGATIRFKGSAEPVAWSHCSLPLTESALRGSLRVLESEHTEQTFPELEKKYATWSANADAGKAQFWTKSITTALDELEGRIQKAKSP